MPRRPRDANDLEGPPAAVHGARSSGSSYPLRVSSTRIPGQRGHDLTIHAARAQDTSDEEEGIRYAQTACGLTFPLGQDEDWDLMPVTTPTNCERCATALATENVVQAAREVRRE